jgi:hypothetical protein
LDRERPLANPREGHLRQPGSGLQIARETRPQPAGAIIGRVQIACRLREAVVAGNPTSCDNAFALSRLPSRCAVFMSAIRVTCDLAESRYQVPQRGTAMCLIHAAMLIKINSSTTTCA